MLYSSTVQNIIFNHIGQKISRDRFSQ